MGSATAVGLLYVAFATVPAAMTVVAWRHRTEPAGTPLVVAGLGATLTAVWWGLWLLPVTPAAGVGASAVLVAYGLGLDTATVGAFYVGAEYTGRDWLERPAILAGIVAVSVPFSVATSNVAPLVGVETLPAWVQSVEDAIHVLLSAGLLGMLAGRTLTTHGIYRKQSGTLLAGFGFSTGAGGVSVLTDPSTLNPIPVGLTVGGVGVAWALFRYEFLQSSPVARQRLFDRLTEPVLAIDDQERLLDLNTAARETFRLDGDAVGDDIAAVLRPDPALRDRYADALEDAGVGAVREGNRVHFDPAHPVVEGVVETGGGAVPDTEMGLLTEHEVCYFDLTVTPLDGDSGAGKLLIWRDVTEQTQREQELELLKQVQSRVLRHNIRNDVTVIRGAAGRIAERTTGEVARMAAEVVETSQELVKTAEEARRIEDVMGAESRAVLDLAAVVDTAVGQVRDAGPSADIDVAVPAGTTVRANPYLGTAIQAIVENGVVHGTGDRPHVEVRASQDGPWVHLVIADEGPGIPRSELQAVQRGEETDLVHGSGAGLWLVQIGVDESRGRIRYEVGDGTTVHISLPAAE